MTSYSRPGGIKTTLSYHFTPSSIKWSTSKLWMSSSDLVRSIICTKKAIEKSLNYSLFWYSIHNGSNWYSMSVAIVQNLKLSAFIIQIILDFELYWHWILIRNHCGHNIRMNGNLNFTLGIKIEDILLECITYDVCFWLENWGCKKQLSIWGEILFIILPLESICINFLSFVSFYCFQIKISQKNN